MLISSCSFKHKRSVLSVVHAAAIDSRHTPFVPDINYGNPRALASLGIASDYVTNQTCLSVACNAVSDTFSHNGAGR